MKYQHVVVSIIAAVLLFGTYGNAFAQDDQCNAYPQPVWCQKTMTRVLIVATSLPNPSTYASENDAAWGFYGAMTVLDMYDGPNYR